MNELGIRGEEAVSHHLIHNRYTICRRNYRSRWGEIDIIARRGDLYLFIEVKARVRETVEHGLLVGFSKQRKIIKTALVYCAEQGISGAAYRFDVAYVEGEPGGVRVVDYIEDAFTADVMFP